LQVDGESPGREDADVDGEVLDSASADADGDHDDVPSSPGSLPELRTVLRPWAPALGHSPRSDAAAPLPRPRHSPLPPTPQPLAQPTHSPR